MRRFDKKTKIAIVGGGEFGFYIAKYLGDYDFENVFVYDSDVAVIENMKKERKHPKKFTEILLPQRITPTESLEECVSDAEILFAAVPAQRMREAVIDFKKYLRGGIIIINVAKALELSTHKRMDEVFSEVLHGVNYKSAAIAGGMLAKEGVLGHRLEADVACEDIYTARRLAALFGSNTLRLKPTKDIIGVEIAGALKNIYAIGAGVYSGISKKLNLGEGICTEYTLVSEGGREGYELAQRYAQENGVKIMAETFALGSQAWLADLGTTSRGGRNSKFGKMVGEGIAPETAKNEIGTVEGYATTKAVYDLLEGKTKPFPIFREIYLVLYESKNPIEAMDDLMNTPHVVRRH